MVNQFKPLAIISVQLRDFIPEKSSFIRIFVASPLLSFALEQLVKQQVKLKGTRACLLGIFVYLPCRTVWGTT